MTTADMNAQARNLAFLVLQSEKKYEDAKGRSATKNELRLIEDQMQSALSNLASHFNSHDIAENDLDEMIMWLDTAAKELGVTSCPASHYLEKKLGCDTLRNKLSRLFPVPPTPRQKVSKI